MQVGVAATRLGARGGIDGTALPFTDASFGGPVSGFGIAYCPPAALAEAARELRPCSPLRILCIKRRVPPGPYCAAVGAWALDAAAALNGGAAQAMENRVANAG